MRTRLAILSILCCLEGLYFQGIEFDHNDSEFCAPRPYSAFDANGRLSCNLAPVVEDSVFDE